MLNILANYIFKDMYMTNFFFIYNYKEILCLKMFYLFFEIQNFNKLKMHFKENLTNQIDSFQRKLFNLVWLSLSLVTVLTHY